MVQPSFKFVEIADYNPSNTDEILQGLNTIKLIVTPSQEPTFLQDDIIKKALEIADVALRHFSTISQKARQSLVEIAKLMILDQPVKKMDQEASQKTFIKVTKLFLRSKEIGKSICTMSSLLTPAREFMDTIDEETSDRCSAFVKLAIKHFDRLDSVPQENLVEVKRLTLLAQPQHLFMDVPKKTFYFTIIEVFSDFKIEDKAIKPPSEAIPKPRLATWREPHLPPAKQRDAVDKFMDLLSDDYSSGSTFFSYAEIGTDQTSLEERNLKAFMYPREKVKKDQIALISRLFEGIIKDYVPYLLQCTPESPLYLLSDQIKAQFIKRFPKTALQAFFQEPRNISDREIKLICCVFSKITMFFQDLNKCRVPAEANLSVDVEQREIIKRMNVLRGPSKKVIIPDDLDRKVVHQNLLAQAQELIHNIGKSDKSSLERDLETPGFLLSLIILECFDRAFSPYTFSLIIDRLLADQIDLENPEKSIKTPPLAQYDSSNKVFSETIGTIIVQLATEIIKCGNPTGVTNAVAEILKILIERFKVTIGETIQKFLNELTNSECSILPILFTQHILFRKDQTGAYQPTLLSQFKKDKEQQAAFQQSVEYRLFQRLFPIIVEAVNKKSAVGAMLIKNASSVEEFCKNLARSLWRLSQQEMLLKMLLSYLIEGINEAVVDQKP